ncbi:MAG: type II secretion system inner membrane protein GspF [Alphaproteobacteria bacterium]|nr:type II secretion system inner membrane protein GspF [Alphaproteobacteria bacterium]
MPAFVYHAVDPAGRPQRGVVEASNAAGARRVLRERKMLPVSVTLSSEKGRAQEGGQSRGRSRGARLGAKSLALATRQLATLIGNDVRTEEALRTVAQQASSADAAALLWNLRTCVIEGKSLSAALTEQGESFPEFYRASVAAGEQSGKLGQVLGHLAEFVETKHATQQKIQLAMLYPALLATVSLIMVTLLLVYVVPDIVRVFVSRGVELPFLTQALIWTSGFVSQWGLVMLGAAAAAVWLVRRWLKAPANTLRFDRWIATAPLAGPFSRKLNSARFAGTLATLVQSGVPLLDAMRAAAASTPNRHIRGRVEQATARINEGASLRQAIEEAGCFPPMLLAMVASGEASGKLGASLERASADQERDLSAMVATLVALVEPGVLLLMGGVVLLLVLAILLPIVNLNNLAGM